MGIFQFTASEVINMVFISFLFGLVFGVMATLAFIYRDKLKSLTRK